MKINSLKVIPIIAILLLMLSCNEKQETIKRYGPSNIHEGAERYLNLEEIQSYYQLTEFIEKTICENERPVINFETSKATKELIPVNNCEMIKWDPNPRDIITFQKTDGVLKSNKVYPIDSISYILKNDFNNTSKNADFTSTPEKLILIIEQTMDSDISKLQDLLSRITEAYDEIDTSNSLRVLFDLNKKPPKRETAN